MVAALFVETDGCYFGLDGVEPWDVRRDARLYAGPHPVVAHPPCQRWGRFWHGSTRNAAERVEELVLTGQYTRAQDERAEFGMFDTPEVLAKRLVAEAGILEGDITLEPSGGLGALIKHISWDFGCTTVEIAPGRAEHLKTAYPAWSVVQADFLTWVPGENIPKHFDHVVMNPPFAKRADIHHILHAFKFLKPGGSLVAIASASVGFRDDALGRDFRSFVSAHHGDIEPLPDGSFKESGTLVNTCIVTMQASP